MATSRKLKVESIEQDSLVPTKFIITFSRPPVGFETRGIVELIKDAVK